LTPELRAEIERFYADPASPNATKRDRRRWSRVQRDLVQMKSEAPASSNGSNAGVTE
jgi:hypothetical protein